MKRIEALNLIADCLIISKLSETKKRVIADHILIKLEAGGMLPPTILKLVTMREFEKGGGNCKLNEYKIEVNEWEEEK